MRKHVILLTVLILLTGCARLQVVPEGERRIQGVYPIAMEKNKIYKNTLEWMTKKLSSSSEDIVVKDEAKGRIMGRGMNFYHEYLTVFVKRPFTFIMTVDVKDNKYRITYDSITVNYEENTQAQSSVKYKSEFDNIKIRLAGYTEELKGFLNSRLRENEDWDKEKDKKEEEW